MAGQYAKPRSKATEVVNGVEYDSFRGDIVNGLPLDQRTPDPNRLLQAYFHSAATINYSRALLASDFSDLHHPENWTLDHVVDVKLRESYQKVVTQLVDALDFMKTIGADGDQNVKTAQVYMSHEGLLLDYESGLTRECTKGYYNLGAHFLWIGDRTRQIGGAHVEYFRGLRNPIGIKVGPSMDPDELVRLLGVVDAEREPGRVTLITRYGADNIQNHLAVHIKAVQQTGHVVVWCSDPMHGNTHTASTGVKTRSFQAITSELVQAFEIHKQCGSQLCGVHLELTGEAVTETVGGSAQLSECDLLRNYQTHCDPRLNHEQALDVAYRISEYFRSTRLE